MGVIAIQEAKDLTLLLDQLIASLITYDMMSGEDKKEKNSILSKSLRKSKRSLTIKSWYYSLENQSDSSITFSEEVNRAIKKERHDIL